MGLLSFIGAGGGEAIAAPVKAVGNVLDELFTSEEEVLTKKEALERLAMIPDDRMAEITKIEAANANVWVSGWRPGIGWVCVLSLAAYYPPRFIMATILWTREIWALDRWVPPPDVGIQEIIGLVGTLLGMATLRTWEKTKGVHK